MARDFQETTVVTTLKTFKTAFPLTVDPADQTATQTHVGKRFNRVKAVEYSDGSRVQEIDRDLTATREQMRARSIRILEDAGIPVSESLEDAPGGSMLRDLVLNSLDHPADSALGLAARIVELCNRLDWYEAEGAPLRVVIPAALLLGRLDALAKVYRVTEDTTAPELQKGPEARKKYTDAKKDEWVKVWREMLARNPRLKISSAALTIAKECGHEPAAARTIRLHLSAVEKAVGRLDSICQPCRASCTQTSTPSTKEPPP